MDEIEKALYDTHWWSNLKPYSKPVAFKGVTYLYPENFFQAMKVNPALPGQREERIKIAGMDPLEAHKYGQTIELRPEWREKWRDQAMIKALKFKFEEGTPEAQMLIDTGTSEIVYDNNFGDAYWGVDSDTRQGQNRLGEILMSIRKELQEGSKAMEDNTNTVTQPAEEVAPKEDPTPPDQALPVKVDSSSVPKVDVSVPQKEYTELKVPSGLATAAKVYPDMLKRFTKVVDIMEVKPPQKVAVVKGDKVWVGTANEALFNPQRTLRGHFTDFYREGTLRTRFKAKDIQFRFSKSLRVVVSED